MMVLAPALPALGQVVTVPRIQAPPKLDDFATFEAPRGSTRMAAIDQLVQRTPVDGAPISERTVVYLGYDAKHLYAVFVCSSAPGTVRAHRVNRDRLPDDDDSVALQLDTFHDRRRLYGFQVNPAGVQVDGIYTEGQGWDLSFDTTWTAETVIRPNGYVVVITVPFSSMRFPAAAEHRWGIFVYRGLPRKNEEAFWPAYSTRFQSRIAYAAELNGLRELDAGHSAQIIPYATFRNERLAQPASSRATEQLAELQGGVDMKTVMRESMVVDLTANPDFSQVESDEPQATVNKRFEVLFPEKRPFFLENASYFETPVPVLFTRRIGDPRVGARFTGKIGPYAVGSLVTDDVAAESGAPGSDAGSRALTSVVRLSRDVGAESHVGLIYVGRNDSAFDNHVAGADGRWRVNRNWVATAQALASTSRLPDVDSRAGTALRAGVEASGRLYAYSLAVTDISPGFRASLGFVPRTDMREITQVTGLTWRPAGRRVVSWGPALTLTRIWDYREVPLEGSARLETKIDLRRQTRFSVFHAIKEERLRPEDLPILRDAARFDQWTTGVTVASAPWSALAFSGEFSVGTAVNLTPAAGRLPALGDARSATVTASVRPVPALTLDTTYIWNQLADRVSAATAFSDRIVRTRVNYQITNRLSARAIVRHELLSSDDRLSSLSGHRDGNLDVLVTYLVQPGTALYAGFNVDRQHRPGRRTDQVFVKISLRVLGF